MCLHPIQIPNPNRIRDLPNKYQAIKDYDSQYINVPCGYCKECISKIQMEYVQRVQMEATKNELFFGTLTYSNNMMPKYYTYSVHGEQIEIPYADSNDFVHMCKRIKKWKLIPYTWKYFAVTELGGKKSRPHIHFIIFIPKAELKNYGEIVNAENLMYWVFRNNWCRNIGTNWKPDYVPLFEYHEKFYFGKLHRNYDFHYVQKYMTAESENDVAFYVTKYLLKRKDKNKRMAEAIKNEISYENYEKAQATVKSKSFYTKYLGLNPSYYRNEKGKLYVKFDEDIINYIKKCISISKATNQDYAQFYNPNTGASFPLARYYKSFGECYTFEDALHFYKKTHPDFEVNIEYTRENLYQLYKTKTNKLMHDLEREEKFFEQILKELE